MNPKEMWTDTSRFWFLLLFLRIGLVKGKDGCKDLNYLDCIQNKILTGHAIKSSRVIVPGLQICQNNCYHEDQCVSYNLGPVEGHSRTCELSAADHWTRPSFLVSKKGFKYCPIQNHCSSNPCPADRLCTPDFVLDTFSCNDGGWTTWGSWYRCAPPCPQTRERTCTNPAPQLDGANCTGAGEEQAKCTMAFEDNSACQSPLGIESKTIADSQISASSSYAVSTDHLQVRLNLRNLADKSSVGAWCSKTNKPGEFIQVDFGVTTRVTKVATQARPTTFNQTVTKYSLAYSSDGSMWTDYEGCIKMFRGNTGVFGNTIVTNELKISIETRYIRLIVQEFHEWPCMRMELYGCALQ